MPTFASWEREALTHTYDLVDFISCHAYYEPEKGDIASFLGSGIDMDHFIDSVVSTADHVGAQLRSRKKINVSFDEWNVWYLSRLQDQPLGAEWRVAPRLSEDRYDVADAVVVGGLLITLLRHSDRVTAASLAQLVNVIAPISTAPNGGAWRQTTYHPFALTGGPRRPAPTLRSLTQFSLAEPASCRRPRQGETARRERSSPAESWTVPAAASRSAPSRDGHRRLRGR